jgi:hypothetical protein
MKVLIVGSEGSMGKRYQAILKSLEVPFLTADVHHSVEQIINLVKECSAIIIATPTNTHLHYLRLFSSLGKPILCEKPLSKDVSELLEIQNIVREKDVNLTMVMQYKMLIDPDGTGPSYYDYFRHGNDGLAWDCIQILSLAKGKVSLKEDSPIWHCMINGKKLNLSDMDKAYIDFIRFWLKKPGDKIGDLIEHHLRVLEYQEKNHAIDKH